MAIEVESLATFYRLLAADTKPANPDRILAYETDTGNWFIYNGTAWVAYNGPSLGTPGTGASNLGKAEDAAHTTGDVGVMALGVQKATPADISTDGDYTPFQMSGGLQWVRIGAGIGDRTPAHTAPTATGTTGAMLASNASRKAALLINIGSVDVFINLGAAAVANTGILLQANGGAFNMSDMLGNLDTAVINGITASGTAIVLVTEWT